MKKFVWIPTVKKELKRTEALRLREAHRFLMGVHLFLLTFIDIFIHNWDIIIMVGDAILLWLNFYNYMTLSKIACAFNVVVYFMFTIIAFTHIERIFTE
jgi:hypothetical protein